MKFVILFKDNPSADPGIRKRHMPAHLDFLEQHSGQIESAGPLHTTAGDGAGGIWIVDAEDEATADELVKSDPFWPTGLRESYQILCWTQVYANGRRLINPTR